VEFLNSHPKQCIQEVHQMVLSNKEKGEQAESKFKEWLDRNNIPYWYVQQDLKTFSPALKKYFGSKRPDFMILLPNLGFMFVDVEYKKLVSDFKKFPLDCEEISRYSNLQRNFNLRVWYALSNEDYDYKTWFWIPVSKVLEVGKIEKFTSTVSGTDFFAIPISDFIQISFDDSLDRLFSKCFLKDKD